MLTADQREAVEVVAKSIWNEREKLMPERVRQDWNDGTYLARQTTRYRAAKALGFRLPF